MAVKLLLPFVVTIATITEHDNIKLHSINNKKQAAHVFDERRKCAGI